MPAGQVAVLREILLVAYSTAGTCSLVLKSVQDLIPFKSSGNPTVIQQSHRLVFNAGETMRISVDSTEWSWVLCGYLLNA